MLSGQDEGPVYYREIQKNAFLKRIPNDINTSKLRPLGHKKPPLKPMWTLFCVHNGRTPFLEQYPEPDSAATLAHRPAWRACLRTARHVTASVKPHAGDEYDFLVDTDHGPVRMLAPDWDSMQDWVSVLRSKLHELRIVSRGENVYGAPPAAPPPRAAARDPTSPLPPTPPVPPDRVPGIDLTPITRPVAESTQITENSTTASTSTSNTVSHNTTTIVNHNANISTNTTNITNMEHSLSAQDNLNSPRTIGNTVNTTNSATSITLNSSTRTPITPTFTNSITTSSNPSSFSPSVTFTNTNINSTNRHISNSNKSTYTNATVNTTNGVTFAHATVVTNVTTSLINAQSINTSITTTFPNENTNTTLTFSTTSISKPSLLSNIRPTGIEFTKATTSLTNVSTLASQEINTEVDISNWEPFSLPSTSRDSEPKKSVAKICGQNICLDDSILKRNVTDSDKEFFAEIDKIHDSAENISDFEFTQRVVVNNSAENSQEQQSTPLRTNITVIQVSNKGAPHTAIPVLGPETDVFNFNFEQNVTVNRENTEFVNIVNTDGQGENSYGTVFEKPSSDYGHISLTTTVSLTGDVKPTDNRDGVYERLCMASTSNKTASPLSIRKIKANDKLRKSSLPNLEIESDYEYLFPNSNLNAHSNRQNLPNGRENHVIHSNTREIRSNPVPNGRHEVPIETPSNTEAPSVNICNISLDSGVRVVRSNVERSQSQNAYDSAPSRDNRRLQNSSPKRETKIEKSEHQQQQKPIWRRGLTELSLLSRLRGIGQAKRQDSPTRHENEDRGVTSPVKVLHRSRPAGRVDSSRRRSNSLTNSQSPSTPQNPALQPLRARQAAALRAEQRRGACVATTAPVRDPPLLCDYERQVWVARWGMGGGRGGGRAGDRVAALAGSPPCSTAHARHLLKAAHTPLVDILFHRVPLGKIYVINKKDQENLGIKLDNECTIVSVDGQSPAGKAGLPPPGKWAVTEVNNRPINLVKGGEEEMNRIAMHGSEVSVLIQPAALVKKLRAAIKSNKPLLGIR